VERFPALGQVMGWGGTKYRRIGVTENLGHFSTLCRGKRCNPKQRTFLKGKKNNFGIA
jgi:hypothetical protein